MDKRYFRLYKIDSLRDSVAPVFAPCGDNRQGTAPNTPSSHAQHVGSRSPAVRIDTLHHKIARAGGAVNLAETAQPAIGRCDRREPPCGSKAVGSPGIPLEAACPAVRPIRNSGSSGTGGIAVTFLLFETERLHKSGKG